MKRNVLESDISEGMDMLVIKGFGGLRVIESVVVICRGGTGAVLSLWNNCFEADRRLWWGRLQAGGSCTAAWIFRDFLHGLG